MAKGKHAAASATRRLEAAHEHIDRLTEQLAESKIRHRQAEADAARLPAVEEALRLTAADRDAATSGEVRRLEGLVSRQREEIKALEERVGGIQHKWERLIEWLPGRFGVDEPDLWDELASLFSDSSVTTLFEVNKNFAARMGRGRAVQLERARRKKTLATVQRRKV